MHPLAHVPAHNGLKNVATETAAKGRLESILDATAPPFPGPLSVVTQDATLLHHANTQTQPRRRAEIRSFRALERQFTHEIESTSLDDGV